MKYSNCICASLLAVLFVPLLLCAQTSGGRFLLWQPSAASMGMGGAGVALHEDAYAASYNPAALCFSEQLMAVGTFANPLPFLGGVGHTFTGVSYGNGSLGFALTSDLYWMGSQYRTSENGSDIIGIEKAFHWQIKASGSYALNEQMGFGVSLAYTHIKLSSYGTGREAGSGIIYVITSDLGFYAHNLLPECTVINDDEEEPLLGSWTANDQRCGFSVGASILNLGPKVSFIDDAQKDNLPALACIGFSYIPVKSNLAQVLVAGDYRGSLYNDPTLASFNFGCEVKVLKLIALRTGYVDDPTTPETSYMTYGAGLCTQYVSVNIARYERALLPTWHYDITISKGF